MIMTQIIEKQDVAVDPEKQVDIVDLEFQVLAHVGGGAGTGIDKLL